MAGVSRTIRAVLSIEPKFFNYLKKEKWTRSYFFAVVSMLLIIPFVLLQLPFLLSMRIPKITALLIPFYLILIAVQAFIAPFINSAIIHLGVLVFGARQGFFATFKPVSYSIVIRAFYGIIAMVLSFGLLLFMDNMEVAIVLNILMIILALISLLHYLTFQVKGISQLQNISKLRAFFGIIFVPLVIILVIGILILFILLINAVV